MRTPVVLLGVLSLAGLALSSTSARAAGDDAPGVSPSAQGSTTTTVTTTAVVNKGTDKVAPGTVVVHLTSPQSVNLEHRQGVGAAAGQWQYQCTSPCDSAVPSGDEFRLTGTGLNPSKTFVLKSGDGQKVTLEVSPGKKSKATAGFVLLGVGAALAIGGTVTILAGARGGSQTFPDGIDTSTTHNSNTNFILAGTSLILGGVIVAVLGGAWAVDNSSTGVGTGDKSPPPATDNATSPTTPTENPSNGGSTIVSSRAPVFVETQAQKLTSGVPTYTVPLFSKTF